MAEAATREGVVNDRMAMLDAIGEKREEVVFQELKDSGFDPAGLMSAEEPASDGRPDNIPQEEWDAMSDEAKGKAKQPETTEETVETPEVKAEPKPEPVKTVKIKVDGQELEVPEAEIIAAGIRAKQKDSTADKRLEEATRLLREAEARSKEQLGGPSKDGHVAPQSEEDARALAHAIQYGSEDEAAAAVEKLTKRQTPGGLTAEQIAFIVDERTQFREAVQWYRTDAKDIAEDPILHSLFLQKEQQQIAAGDRRPYQERYQEIAKELRDWIGTKVPTKDPLADKRERKANAPAHPTPAAVRQPAPQPEKEPTPQETIAEMRRARHQA